MHRLLIPLIVLIATIQISCGDESSSSTADVNEKVIWVNSRLVDCEGSGPMKCMQIKESEDGQWQNFYGSIQGFSYKQGIFYTLRVNITKVENPPTDAPSLKYELIEVVQSTADPAQHAYKPRPDLYKMKWRLKSYTPPGKEAIRVPNELVVTFNIEDEFSKVSGIAACNDYFGTAEIDGSNITIKGIGLTEKACAEEGAMELEKIYTSMLGNVIRIQPAKSVFMTMLTKDGGELLFLPAGEKE